MSVDENEFIATSVLYNQILGAITLPVLYIYIYISFFFPCGAGAQRGSWPSHS